MLDYQGPVFAVNSSCIPKCREILTLKHFSETCCVLVRHQNLSLLLLSCFGYKHSFQSRRHKRALWAHAIKKRSWCHLCSCVFLFCSWRWCKKVSDTSLVFLSGVASLKKKKEEEEKKSHPGSPPTVTVWPLLSKGKRLCDVRRLLQKGEQLGCRSCFLHALLFLLYSPQKKRSSIPNLLLTVSLAESQTCKQCSSKKN